MSDAQTLRAYAARAAEYARFTGDFVDPLLAEFLARLPENGHILDLGCGPGRDAAIMAEAGYRVTAVDAVPEMVAMAARHPDVETRIMRFDEMSWRHAFDGIWANFSLLHAQRGAMSHHLAAIARALKPGGYLHLALKTGS